MNYKRFDTVIGWLVFAVAAVTYLMTIEPTASFWDCSEFITSGYKLEVGHPPVCLYLCSLQTCLHSLQVIRARSQ